jgi:gliding motility-associated-like protein
MSGKDDIKELFGDKLSGFEENVRPELWTNISSQITPVPTGTGMSLFTKVMIGISAAASAGVISFYLFKSSDNAEKPKERIVNTENVMKNNDGQDNKETTSIKNNVPSPQIKSTTSTEAPSINSYEDLILDLDVSDYSEPIKEQKQDDDRQLTDKQAENKETVPVANENAVQDETNAVSNPILEQKEEAGTIGELFNVFTPNGDGANDVLYVDSKDITDFSIVVIDQQNKIVYQSTDATFRWDGTGMNGDPVPAGNYLYYVTARNSAGKVLSKHSVLQITR